ncbi:hypothetical protein [Emticicia agri]|uniref:Uncharacterized protein n=1 Tax=Emticicia agri TaxID=2492393 RepID=A0A4Q5LSX5_9BACT|nr:hypothetical protein [Emticicia agri]RYU92706.1 hypothetical protein EWM59_25865 [Emticicia agri]
MPLDIYLFKNHEPKKFLGSVNIENSAVWEVIWEKLSEASALSIDPYGTTRLYANHVSTLLRILNNFYQSESTVLQLREILEPINLGKNDCVLFEGD